MNGLAWPRRLMEVPEIPRNLDEAEAADRLYGGPRQPAIGDITPMGRRTDGDAGAAQDHTPD